MKTVDQPWYRRKHLFVQITDDKSSFCNSWNNCIMADFGEQNVQCHNDDQYLFQNEKKNDMSFIVMLKPNKSFVCENWLPDSRNTLYYVVKSIPFLFFSLNLIWFYLNIAPTWTLLKLMIWFVNTIFRTAIEYWCECTLIDLPIIAEIAPYYSRFFDIKWCDYLWYAHSLSY